MDYDDKFSKLLKHEIDSINLHLPKKRVSLPNANNGYNFYVDREDNQLYIDNGEINLLVNLCPKDKIHFVFLPILIIRRRDLGRGTYVISGELIEQYLVLKAIKKFDGTWEQFRRKTDSPSLIFLYKPDLIELRKVLPTSTIIGFS